MALTLIVVICGLYPIFTARYCTAYSYMHSHRLNSYLSSVLQNHTIPTARSSLVDSKQLVYRIEPRIPNLPIHGCRRFPRHGSMNGKHNMVRYGCKMRWCPDLWFRPPSVHTYLHRILLPLYAPLYGRHPNHHMVDVSGGHRNMAGQLYDQACSCHCRNNKIYDARISPLGMEGLPPR